MLRDMTETARDQLQTDFPYWPLMGVNDGYSRLALAYRAGTLVIRSKNADISDEEAEIISNIARRVGALGERSQSLSGGFRKTAQRGAEKAVSFTVENSPVFLAAAAGALHGPAATIAGSATATYPHALGAWFLKRLDDAGYDVKDPEQLKSAVNDRAFMKRARRSSHFHAVQMSGAVTGAGVLAGVAYSAVAKPVAGVGANMARTVFPRIMGEFAEKSATMFGDALAKGIKSFVNSAGRKALGSAAIKPYVRSMFLSAALVTSAVEVQTQQHNVEGAPGFPAYNTSLRYI